MTIATPFSDLWFTASAKPGTEAHDAASALARRLEHLPALLAEIDRLVAPLPARATIGRLLMLGEPDRELLEEAVKALQAALRALPLAQATPEDNSRYMELELLLRRLEALHG